MKASDSLLRRVREWDEDALAQAYDEYAPAIYRYAYRLTGHGDVAQEVVSTTFQRLLVALKRGGGPTQHLSAWLYRVAHNLVVDGFRRQPEQVEVELDQATEVAASGGPDETLRHKEAAARVRAALRKLTPLQQQVVALRFLEELSNEETARVVGRTVGAVKGVQHRALRSLRRILEEEDGTFI